MANNDNTNLKFTAYVSTYTAKDKRGITIYDVDNETGVLTEKGKVAISNSSYLTCSHNRKYPVFHYRFRCKRIPDVFRTECLKKLTKLPLTACADVICPLITKDRFIFVSGYHDGKLTVLRLNDDGSIGEITEEIYFKGLGDVMERNFTPHVTCAKMSRDNKFLYLQRTAA